MSNSAFDYHPLSKLTVKEKLIANFTYSQSGWLIIGLFLTTKMADYVPPLPLLDAPLNMIHYVIPLAICSFFGFVSHKTGVSFMSYFLKFIKYLRRKKVKLNHKPVGK